MTDRQTFQETQEKLKKSYGELAPLSGMTYKYFQYFPSGYMSTVTMSVRESLLRLLL